MMTRESHEATGSDVTEREGAGGATIKRRGLIAGAAALVAGIVAARTIQPVAAGSDGDIALNVFTDIYATTGVQAKDSIPLGGGFYSGNWVGSPVLKGDASLLPDNQTYAPRGLYNVDGVQGLGKGAGTGVVGNGGANSGIGVYGFGAGTAAGVQGFGGNVLGAPGVVGVANNASANNGDGVRGFGANGGVGVAGKGGATNATGVIGFGGGSSGQGVAGIGAATGPGIVGVGGNFGATNNADGVQGFANGTGSGVVGHGGGTSGPGLFGFGGGPNGPGLHGVGAGSGAGVYGTSTTGYGVLGYSTGGSASLAGVSTNANIPAFAGGDSVAGGLAAHFSGTVYVDCAAGGQFVVSPMGAKFGTVQHADGSLRLMASMEAPESWAVDVGSGEVANGTGRVEFDKDFASVIAAGEYRVSLTPEGESKGLYVADKTATGFAVREQQGGTSAVGFTWVVYAHPRAQKSERLKKFVAPPPQHMPTADELPKPPPLHVPTAQELPAPAPPVKKP